MRKLPDDVIAKLNEARSALDEFARDAQSYADDKSEKWRESDAGESYAAWIETIEQLASEIEDLPETPE